MWFCILVYAQRVTETPEDTLETKYILKFERFIIPKFLFAWGCNSKSASVYVVEKGIQSSFNMMMAGKCKKYISTE
mgnify:CR=1 FL=1